MKDHFTTTSPGFTPQDDRWPAALADDLAGNTDVYYCPQARDDPEHMWWVNKDLIPGSP